MILRIIATSRNQKKWIVIRSNIRELEIEEEKNFIFVKSSGQRIGVNLEWDIFDVKNIFTFSIKILYCQNPI